MDIRSYDRFGHPSDSILGLCTSFNWEWTSKLITELKLNQDALQFEYKEGFEKVKKNLEF